MAEAFGLTYIGRVSTNAPGADPYTFTSVGLGADVTGGDVRYTVLHIGWLNEASQGNLSSISIGGRSATIIGQCISTTGSFARSALAIVDTSGLGTSADIVGDYSTNIAFYIGIGVYRLVNPNSPTPVASAFPNANASGVLTLSINVNDGGAAVGGIMIHNNAANTITWSGLTEDFDVDISGVSETHSAAHGTSTGSPLAITATSTDTTLQGMAGSSASWEPAAGGGGISVAGALVAGAAMLSADMAVLAQMAGVLSSPASEIAGAAAVGVSAEGTVQAAVADIVGAAAVSIALAGALESGPSDVAGTAEAHVDVTGALAAPAATVAGAATVLARVTGALAAGTSTIAGVVGALATRLVSGALQAGASVVSGAATVKVTVEGALAAAASVVAGVVSTGQAVLDYIIRARRRGRR